MHINLISPMLFCHRKFKRGDLTSNLSARRKKHTHTNKSVTLNSFPNDKISCSINKYHFSETVCLFGMHHGNPFHQEIHL